MSRRKDDITPQIEDGVLCGESIHRDPVEHQDPFFWTINHVMMQGCPFQIVQKLHSKIKNKQSRLTTMTVDIWLAEFRTS